MRNGLSKADAVGQGAISPFLFRKSIPRHIHRSRVATATFESRRMTRLVALVVIIALAVIMVKKPGPRRVVEDEDDFQQSNSDEEPTLKKKPSSKSEKVQ